MISIPDWITLDEVRNHLRLTSNVNDNAISGYLKAAVCNVENMISRHILDSTIERAVRLPLRPDDSVSVFVQDYKSIESIKIAAHLEQELNGEVVDYVDDYFVNDARLIIHSNSGWLVLRDNYSSSARLVVKINVGQKDVASIPECWKQAVLIQTQLLYDATSTDPIPMNNTTSMLLREYLTYAAPQP